VTANRLILVGARTVLALGALVMMMPLSFVGFGFGGDLGARAAESVFGPAGGLVGLILGSVLCGGASLVLPAIVAVRLEKALERRLAKRTSGTGIAPS
jgi:hypothetical protein